MRVEIYVAGSPSISAYTMRLACVGLDSIANRYHTQLRFILDRFAVYGAA